MQNKVTGRGLRKTPVRMPTAQGLARDGNSVIYLLANYLWTLSERLTVWVLRHFYFTREKGKTNDYVARPNLELQRDVQTQLPESKGQGSLWLTSRSSRRRSWSFESA